MEPEAAENSMSTKATLSIQMNDFRRQWAETGTAVLNAVQRVGQSGWYILGSEVEAFERSLATYTQRSYAVGCASGLDAIELALRALGLQPGQKVLTTPLSAFATTLAIVRAGGVPVFVDVDDRGLVDLELAEQALASDPSIRFFVPVHLYGAPLDSTLLQSLRDRYELSIVEDCAQAVGASYNGVPVGSVGQLSILSFYPTKNLGAIGDAGAVLTDDEGLAGRCKLLRDYGQASKYNHEVLGLNSRLDEIQAAILADAFLPRLPAWTARRREIAKAYLMGLQSSGCRCLRTQGEPVWHLFPAFVPASSREDFARTLRSHGVPTGVHYPKLIPLQPAMKDVRHEVIGQLTVGEQVTEQQISLPIHPYLSDSEVEHVTKVVSEWHTTTSR
jgi:dTDP-3-amino-3,4,6-trideoxy-alpha-D-glucose transaminase